MLKCNGVGSFLRVVALITASVCAFAVDAQDYPNRPIQLIVPPGAGGGTDLLFRALAKSTEPHLGQPIVVVNKPGAGGAIGTAEIARAKPDGYTIGAVLQQIYLPMMRPELSYREKDFTYIMMVNADPMVITVKADKPWKNLADLIAAAKATPGKITVGNCGAGCISHLAAGMVERGSSVKFSHVPFDGHSPGRTALLGGHLDVMVMTPSEAVDFVKAGQIRALAVIDTKRTPILPDVPTMKEAAGYDLTTSAWRSVGGPAGMPADVVSKLTAAFRKGMDDPVFRDFAQKGGFQLEYMDSSTMAAFIAKERPQWEQTLKDFGLYKAQ